MFSLDLPKRSRCEIVDSTIPAEQKENFMSTADILREEGEESVLFPYFRLPSHLILHVCTDPFDSPRLWA